MKRDAILERCVKPPALRNGDTVGIIAPASNIKLDALSAGCETLRRMGYKPFYFDSIFEQDLYFAGSLERRTLELHKMFEREEVRAIVCARGGYGCNHLVPGLNLDLIRRHPKIFVGYSDITTLLTLFCDEAGLTVFHGPMAAKDLISDDGVDVLSWQCALGAAAAWDIADNGARGLRDGRAEGMLYGGCLPMLTATLGTPNEIQTVGRVLFVEDIGSKPYQIDRMLMQLKLAGKLEGVAGIIFGEMNDCVQHPQQGYTLEEVVLRIVSDLNIPVAFGLRSGHVARRNITLPLGIQARLDVAGQEVQLTFLESATTA
jgi:muramoyltetrapeptide carboxypeptidase